MNFFNRKKNIAILKIVKIYMYIYIYIYIYMCVCMYLYIYRKFYDIFPESIDLAHLFRDFELSGWFLALTDHTP